MYDPELYRSKDEVEEWKKRDPVPLAREKLLGAGVHEDQLVSLEAAVKAEVQEAVRFAEASPPAKDEDVFKWVYANPETDPRKM